MKSFRLLLPVTAILSFMFIACKQDSKKNTSDSLEGVYQQLGYGHIAKIEGGKFVLYDVTKISCLVVMDESIEVYGDNLTIHNDTLRLKDGINDYRFVNIASAPELCERDLTEDQKNDPLYNFEVLAETFDEHYAYFDLRKVNWDSLRTATKRKITKETTDIELYIILEDMLDSFEDGHIGLDAPSELGQTADSLRNIGMMNIDKDNIDVKTYGNLEVASMVAKHYLKDGLKSTQSELIKWGLMEDNIGYIQINLMMGHANLKLADSLKGMPYLRAYFNELEDLTSEAHTKLEVQGIKATLDQVMKDLTDTRAIVLDVRFNGGGKDEVGMEIIRHFNPSKHLVFSKKARIGKGFSKTNDIYLEGSDAAYIKPMYLLSSQQSASATEIMVMSSLQLKHVKRVGGHTEGVFSDVLDKVLPNEWVVGLSNEVYLDNQGVNYEGKGIPVNIELGYPEDRQNFFRLIANDLDSDKHKILDIVLNKKN